MGDWQVMETHPYFTNKTGVVITEMHSFMHQ
jgi:hypothetical protein